MIVGVGLVSCVRCGEIVTGSKRFRGKFKYILNILIL